GVPTVLFIKYGYNHLFTNISLHIVIVGGFFHMKSQKNTLWGSSKTSFRKTTILGNVKSHISFALLIIDCCRSAANIKSKGERGSPYLTPLLFFITFCKLFARIFVRSLILEMSSQG
ncbi:hypothetical protein ACJX0J_040396, partial [Zea mays]